MKNKFDFNDFQTRLKELAADPSENFKPSGSIVDCFFRSDRHSFLQYVYSVFLCRPLDPDAGVYFQHLDRPLGRLYVWSCVGSSLEAINRKQHSPLLHFTCKLVRKAFRVCELAQKTLWPVVKKVGPKASDHDYFYKCFEDEFRGSSEEILKSIEKRYDPLIPYALGVERALDLGSGRGELLQFLEGRGYKATGVDTNSFFVQEAIKQNLDVRKEDAVQFLKKQDDSSFSIITSLHLVEHLELKELLDLIDECRRVLKPGGIIIVETPNARNIHVSSGDFYRDPTHKNPLFPDTLDFMFRFYNFDGDCFFFGKDNTVYKASKHVFDNLKQYQIVSRDQVWIGKKPGELLESKG